VSHRRLLLPVLLLALPFAALAQSAPAAPAPAPRISLLDVTEGRKAIVDDSAEPYFERLQAAEIQAKTGVVSKGKLAALRKAARGRYANAVQAFTPEEQEVLRWLVSELHPVMQRDYPLIGRTPWSFIKVAPELEGGMPHTRGGHIVLSTRHLGPAVELYAAGQKDELRLQLGSLLLHEQLHVVQRAHPKLFAKLFTELWGFQRLKQPRPGTWLEPRTVVNPDGTDTRWVYPVTENGQTRWVWPLVILKDMEGTTLSRNLRMVAVALKDTPGGLQVETAADGAPRMEELASLPSLTTRFPSRNDLYHPNEIASSFFATLVTVESLFPEGQLPKEAREKLLERWEPFRTWLRTNLR